MSERLDLLNCEDADDDRMSEFRSVASKLASSCEAYRRELARAYVEIDAIKTCRDEWKRDAERLGVASVKAACITRTRETIDGVECERIKGLDVIVPVGLIPDGEEPAEVRSCGVRFGKRWVNSHGEIQHTASLAISSGNFRLLLADKPAPATTPTWMPPAGFPLIRFNSCNSRRAIQVLDEDGSRWLDEAYMKKWFPAFDLPPDGSWRVCAGDRATYLGPNQEATT